MITVSIVTYMTDLEELRRCLQSLTSPLVSHIFIVDNSNMKEIADFSKLYPNVTYIGSDNVGYGAGHNKALRQVLDKGEKYHLVLNSDVYFEPNVLDNIVEYMDANEDVAQVIPNTIYPNGNLQYVCRLLPTPFNLVFRRFLPNWLSNILDYRFLLKDYDRKTPMNIPFLLGSFMFFRMDCFKKVGIFDERIFMYMEDIDITRRMHRYYKTMFWPYATIVHAHRGESYKNKKMLKIHMKSAIFYFNKWGWLFDKERHKWNGEVLSQITKDAADGNYKIILGGEHD